MSASRAARVPPRPGPDWSSLRPAVTEELLGDVADRIVRQFAPERIVLFGSYAGGTPDSDSDLDLLVVMESQERVAQRIRRVAEVAHVRFLPMDILVYTPAELRHRLEAGDHFLRQVLATGRTFYERVAAR